MVLDRPRSHLFLIGAVLLVTILFLFSNSGVNHVRISTAVGPSLGSTSASSSSVTASTEAVFSFAETVERYRLASNKVPGGSDATFTQFRVARVGPVTPFFLLAAPADSTYYPGSNVYGEALETGRFDVLLTNIARTIMKQHCASGFRGTKQIVDVGAHIGYFSLLGIAHGCIASAIEPYKPSIAYQSISMLINNFPTSSLRQFNAIASDATNVVFNGWNAATEDESKEIGINRNDNPVVSTRTVRVDATSPADVLFLKMDIEGHEPHGMRSASGLFEQHTTYYTMIEVTHFLNGKHITGVAEYLSYLEQHHHTIYWVPSNAPTAYRLAPGNIAEWLSTIKLTPHCYPSRNYCQTNIFTVHSSAPEFSMPGLLIRQWPAQEFVQDSELQR